MRLWPTCPCWLQVKAVVLRINSPGGSAVASDMIAREVQLLKEAGKPVVACMGDVAASGGYYIAGTSVQCRPSGPLVAAVLRYCLQRFMQSVWVTRCCSCSLHALHAVCWSLHVLLYNALQQSPGLVRHDHWQLWGEQFFSVFA